MTTNTQQNDEMEVYMHKEILKIHPHNVKKLAAWFTMKGWNTQLSIALNRYVATSPTQTPEPKFQILYERVTIYIGGAVHAYQLTPDIKRIILEWKKMVGDNCE